MRKYKTSYEASLRALLVDAEEFEGFRKHLRLPVGHTHLLTSQELLARTEATLNLAVYPVLAHARRLSCFHMPD